jgi:hypothetical protein
MAGADVSVSRSAQRARLGAGDPHAFLRLRFIPFLRAAFGAWTQRLAGTFVEIRDSTGGFVAFRACHLSSRWSGCTTGNHDDYECCAPFFGFSRGTDYDGPPPCPVFDRSAN